VHAQHARPARRITFAFVGKDGKATTVTGREGQNLVGVAHDHGVDLEGACECSLACSTCHVILPAALYGGMDGPVDEENDLLDLAFGLTAT
jgi:ferredoxin-2, mitochondrial